MRLTECGFRLLELASGLIENCLIGPRIDLEHKLAGLDERPFLIRLPEQVAGDARLDLCVNIAYERADPFGIDRNVALLDGNDLDVGRFRLGLGLLLAAAERDEKENKRYLRVKK